MRTAATELAPLDRLRLRAATDPALRAAIAADPIGVLRAAGVEIPDGITVRVFEIDVTADLALVELPDLADDEALLLLSVADETDLGESDLDFAAAGAVLPLGGGTILLGGLLRSARHPMPALF